MSRALLAVCVALLAATHCVVGRTIVPSEVETWQDLSSEQLMHAGVFGSDPCATHEIPLFDYIKGFASFCANFGKVYKSNTYNLRFALYKASQNCVQYRNSNHPTNHFFLRLSHLADHTRDEYLKSLGTVPYVPPRFQQKHGHQNVLSAEDGTAALVEAMRSGAASGAAAEADAYTNQAFDWRSKNVLPPVGYQRVCGNCWAWAAKAQVEAAWAIAGNTLRTVSVQQITDCSDPNSCKGCNGGVFGIALLNLKEQGGVCADKDYPYQGVQGTCNKKCAKVAQIKDVKFNFFPTNENELFDWLKVGPVAVGVYAAPDSFMSYGGGVYDDPACNGDNIKINHAMTLTGYGTDPKHGDYWILRNSWATSWGEQGYMRLKRGANQCKIVSQWSQATSDKAATFGIQDGTAPAPPAPPVAPLTPCQTKPDARGVITRGTCQDVTSCTDNGGKPTAHLCPGPASIQCCLNPTVVDPTPPAPVTPTPPVAPIACSTVHPTKRVKVSGSCVDQGICVAAAKLPVRGACAGPSNIQCCVAK